MCLGSTSTSTSRASTQWMAIRGWFPLKTGYQLGELQFTTDAEYVLCTGSQESHSDLLNGCPLSSRYGAICTDETG